MTIAAFTRFKFAAVFAAFLSIFAISEAFAQTNAVGSIFGNSPGGGSVVVTNADTGAVRNATVDANGRFQITALPPGNYNVELQKDGKTVASRSGVPVNVGSGSEVNFGGQAQAQDLDSINVTARPGQFDIDVSATDTRTVFTAGNLEKMSIGRSIEDVALLAPGVVRGDVRYATDKGQPSASFGGAGANENAFYINGYAVTDPVRGLGSSSLPFGGIGQYQLLTGGYGAEFGRATGGVVNIVTKSGTNEWKAGGIVAWAPDAFRANERNIYYPNNGTPSDGVLWRETALRERDELLYGAYVGGPIIKDKLFFYFSGEIANNSVVGPRSFGNSSGSATTGGTAGWHDRSIDVPRYLLKGDWNIADGHTAEFTLISDVTKETRDEYRYHYTAAPIRVIGAKTGGRTFEDGGELYIGKYTGALTDNLLLTALYGQAKNNHLDEPSGYDPSVTPVRDDRPFPTLSFGNLTALADPTAYDKSNGYRLDLQWQLQQHSLRFGYDVQNLEVKDGQVTAGPGYLWLYDNATPGTVIVGSGGAVAPASNGGDFVQKVISASGGIFTTDQYAYFVEDRWQVTDDVMLSLGLRNENFENFNSDKVLFLDQTDQWAPRIGATWDVNSDGSLRAFANVGRYHLAIPLNVAFRQVGGSTNTSEYFSFTTIDPATGVPQGLAPIGSGPFSVNQEYGQARDPDLAAADGLESYYQDEFALGVEAKLSALGVEGDMSELVAGARFIYRNLGSQIDDNCDARPAYNWAVTNGYDTGLDTESTLYDDNANGLGGSNGLDDGAEFFGAQLGQCRIINPGESNTLVLVDANGDKVKANIGAAEWGLPKLDRTYTGLDLFIEHTLRDDWYGKLDWTISRSEGNAEGQLLSDLGQQDVSVTLNWDHPELMVGNNGPLPNDRTHQIKTYGYYQFTSEWRTSVTLTAASGRPKSESGVYGGLPLIDVEPTAVGTCDSACFFSNVTDYGGTFYRYVNGQPTPRGSAGRLPWTAVLDVGGSYSPNFLQNKLTVAIDVFNLFNSQIEQARIEFQETNNPGVTYHSANRPIAYNAPRSGRISMRYDWGL